MTKFQISLSIVIPVYNVADYLPRCIKSITTTWQSGVEVILVDDGSTDASAELCDKYADEFFYIQAIHQQNQGPSAARNAGVCSAKGQYVAFVDADDWVDEQWLSSLLQVISSDSPDIIVFDFYLVEPPEQPQKVLYPRPAGKLAQDRFLRDVAKDAIIQGCVWNKVSKRGLWMQTPFDETIRCLEDYEMICRVVQQAKSVYHLAKPLYFYWQRSSSLIHAHNFTQTWESYQMAQKRAAELGEAYWKETTIAICIQAYRVCRNYAQAADRNNRQQMRQARKFLFGALITAVLDRDLCLKWKIKFILASLGIL